MEAPGPGTRRRLCTLYARLPCPRLARRLRAHDGAPSRPGPVSPQGGHADVLNEELFNFKDSDIYNLVKKFISFRSRTVCCFLKLYKEIAVGFT